MTNVTKSVIRVKHPEIKKNPQKSSIYKAFGDSFLLSVYVCFSPFLAFFELHMSCKVAQKVAQDHITIDDIFDLVFSFFSSK